MATHKRKKVLLILGGLSTERDVSLRTGAAIGKALEELGHEVAKWDPQEDGYASLMTATADAAFIALHGRYGEDGTIQGILESLKIPYTGSGILSSALCYDKVRTKIFLEHYGVMTPSFALYLAQENPEDFIKNLKMKVPIIVKPNREGSTIGMTIIKKVEDLKKALAFASQSGSEILVEDFIEGTEVTVGVLNGKSLPVVEIAPKSGFYDYEAKYTPGKTEYHVPARISAEMTKHLCEVSEKVFSWMSCRGCARMDYILAGDKSYFLEVNTIPGMTETSLVPKAAKGAGIDFTSLCEEILKGATLDNVHV
jgi:D-alanine-D-alanine ligase